MNNIDFKVGEALVAALYKNTTLTHLDLEENHIDIIDYKNFKTTSALEKFSWSTLKHHSRYM
ncbi:5413_t:CDS:2 [Cetraspora pellucida]|uniref:5413_t:CDS:1 n=1 Tax=Cetraspora pellucida TaxID=1433469 RepID=A0A9N9NR00_9GLOM|nr:5413_t:CDS:2 [Cetraspora pellucida]